ncbi:DNA mismatch repair protein MutH [Bacillus cereus]|uniref:DNA mismatch repair protein MutH n=1 Tax=Bacillus cereus TaxID=1396 RepID=UPI000BEB6537|nr:DNA mismatch repair protein MutH [Bacillus cereus]MBJ8024503.1 DNA mismatch repair protein MutH [Bacillus cereus]MBJ8034624.1 DNA mismatch repair protein MutH [Bacillus cereus]PEC85651.1 DNA mismatch repair protein MutH [Bacillus cereus]
MVLKCNDVKKIYRILGDAGLEDRSMDLKSGILEIINDNGDIVEYYVDDFRKENKDKVTFQKFWEGYEQKNNLEIQPLMVFGSWEEEQDFRDNVVAEAKSGVEKRKIKKDLESLKTCYLIQDNEIELFLEEEGINYLEYKGVNTENESGIGLVYNMSLKELYKLYNQTGSELFKDNVRVGISGSQANRLRDNFKTKFLLGLYGLNNSDDKDSEFKEKVNEYLKENNGSDNFNGYQNALGNFWFHHNGITIYSSEKFKVAEDKIIFNPLNVSVINGAQTLTHCTDIVRTITKDLKNKLGQDTLKVNNFINQLMDELKQSVKIKTIFIAVNSKLKRSITLGLNTQIPVKIEDIETKTELVDKINTKLEKKNKKICRNGEERSYGGFLLPDFVKAYLLSRDKPGTARNLNKNKLEEYLKEIDEFLDEDVESVDDFFSNMDVFEYVDKWWRKRERPEMVPEEEYAGLSSNGKFYFKSYCKDVYNDAEDENDKEEYFQGIYESFVDTFIELAAPRAIDSNMLKKDDLYKSYQESRRSLEKDTNKAIELFKEPLELVNKYEMYREYNKSKSNRSMFIKKELEEQGIKIEFRTINVTVKDTEESFILKESFALPSKTFSPFYEINNYPKIYDDDEKVNEVFSFETSYLKKEIEKEFFLFIFVENLVGNLIGIQVIPNFNFSHLSLKAKEVYDDTIDKFKAGNADGFVKASDNKGLHIRPKAKDANDTFTFTDDSQQIKRTFWVNRETLLQMIVPHLEKFQGNIKEKQLVGA